MADRTQQDAWVARVLGVDSTGSGSTGKSVAYQKLRLDWLSTRQHLQGEVATLRAAILERTRETEDFPQVQTGIGVLDGILSALDDRLADALDAVYTCDDPSKRGRLIAASKTILSEYALFVATDPLMRAIDKNPFTPVSVASAATTTLRQMAAALR